MKLRHPSRAVAAALALGLLMAGVGAMSPAAAADDVSVAWPTVTAFNPAVYDYVATISYDGPGVLKVRDTEVSYSTQVVAPGEFRPYFPEDSHLHQYEVKLCLDDRCTVVSTSPLIQAHRLLAVAGDVDRLGPNRATYSRIAPAESDRVDPIAFDVNWDVLPLDDPNGAPIVSGSQSGATAFPAIGATDQLIDGHRYTYRADVSVDGPEWGHLESSASHAFTWDSTPPQAVPRTFFYSPDSGSLPSRRNDGLFLPERDQYGDVLRIGVSADGAGRIQGSYEILDRTGDHVIASGERSGSGRWVAWWTGRDADGQVLPEGTYPLVLTARDEAGNQVVLNSQATISHKKETMVTWRRTFRADKTVLRPYTERCSRVISPARREWRGSVGYRSHTPCARRDDTVAGTTNGVYVPYSPFRDYRGAKVTVTGGKSAGQSWSYIMLNYRSRKGEWGWVTQLGPNVGAHAGATVRGTATILGDWSERHPYVEWWLGLQDGYDYDVKSFTVTVRYLAFK